MNKSGQWYKLDDEKVVSLEQENVLKDAIGGYTSAVYLHYFKSEKTQNETTKRSKITGKNNHNPPITKKCTR